MSDKPLIDLQNVPAWTVAAFILALLALVIALAGIHRTNVVVVGTQSEVLMLAKKVEDMRRGQAPAATPAPAAPATTK